MIGIRDGSSRCDKVLYSFVMNFFSGLAGFELLLNMGLTCHIPAH